MTETDDDRQVRLDALEAKLAEKHAQEKPKRHQEEHYSQAQNAWRMVVELVAGMAVGFAIGYGLDLVLGTTPLLMVVFLLLGFAAGVRAMIATAKDMTSKDVEEERD
ncbi:MAG: AtpZ/AtpI family protein [Pseudomonadota bacterium]